ncbi:hypothetical protein SAMN05444166_4161 [Singulisphaera sp. GP187]|uniref:hypothetical protein n=1 Tax=Singulisphaera sp. GP187 TaxID=1882752 RepID=UPI00092A708E|nr:hypothetical protein [Singulisphaera sp. GP187]SIO37044.1 hypothetical protein SAMN05444166_4161 [Singulisphaera sp. GP187]
MSSERLFGDIEFVGKEIGIPAQPFDKLAISGRGELLLLSVFCDAMRVKQIRAILCGGAKAVANASGIKVGQPNANEWNRHTPGRLTPSSEGYQVSTHKLGYGLVHAMFITRMQGFMPVVSEESLWQELTDVRYTTPLLREWVPHIEKTLRQRELLEDAHAFGCHCGILSASTKHLDEVVSQGLQQYELIIPRPMAV